MDATGVSHIAICVRDMDKSLGFYRDILGMRVTLDQVQDQLLTSDFRDRYSFEFNASIACHSTASWP